MTTRERYEQLRDAHNLTDYEVMRQAGVEKSTFYSWRQRSEADPELSMTVPNMVKIAQVFDVSLDYLVGNVGGKEE